MRKLILKSPNRHQHKPSDQRAEAVSVCNQFHNSCKSLNSAIILLRVDSTRWRVGRPSIRCPHFDLMLPICSPTTYSTFAANSTLSTADFDPIPVAGNQGKATNHKSLCEEERRIKFCGDFMQSKPISPGKCGIRFDRVGKEKQSLRRWHPQCVHQIWLCCLE